MAHHFPVLPKFDRLTASYRDRKSLDMPPGAFPSETTSSPRLINQMSMSLTTKGLLNPTGENNCFLNSAVQVLWHIGVFRRSFREFKGHHCVGDSCIFCSLKFLFSEFQHDTGHSAIPPDQLRQALALCYEGQSRFQLGRMDDAAECFEKLLEQVHYHLTGSDDMDTCSFDYCISHQKFALTILERTECTCGATSEPLSFVQFVHYISSSAFSKEAQRLKSKPSGAGSFSKIVHATSCFGESRQCTNFAKCRKNVVIKRILLNSPDVFSLGFIWDSASPSVDEIMGVVSNIGLTLQLNEVYDHVFSDSAQCNQLQLTAVIAYYGRHYSTFCYHSKLKEWIYFDDAKYRKIGADWSLVCDLIRKAHYQPLLLVYSNDFGENVNLSGAPTEVIMTSESPKNLPTLDETPEEIELANQIADEKATTSNVGMATGRGGQSSHAIDPMTLSIVPSGQASQTHTQGASSSDNLMMFSLSPANAGGPHPSAGSAALKSKCDALKTTPSPSHSAPSLTHKPEPSQSSTPTHAQAHRSTSHSSVSAQARGSTSHTPTHMESQGKSPPSHLPMYTEGYGNAHRVLTQTLTPGSTSHTPTHTDQVLAQTQTQGNTSHTSVPTDRQSIARPRPQPSTSSTKDKPKLRMNPKSQVSVEETKVQAQPKNVQGDDLMSFSIAPTVLSAQQKPTSFPTSINSRSETEVLDVSHQDLIKFSITAQDVAQLHRQQFNTVPGSHHYSKRSHDSHMTASVLTPKWDHFKSESRQQQTNFGMTPDQSLPEGGAQSTRGVSPDQDHWALLTLNGSERVLAPDGSPASPGPPGSPLTGSTESAAVKSLRRVASLSEPSSPTGKLPSPTGNFPPQVGKHSPFIGQMGKTPAIGSSSPGLSKPKRELPEIPIPQSKSHVSTNVSTGTYVELDFEHMPQGQGSKYVLDTKGKQKDQREYEEIIFTSRVPEKKDESSTTREVKDGDTLISPHPLYAIPDKVKMRLKDSSEQKSRHSVPPSSHVTETRGHVTRNSTSSSAEINSQRSHTSNVRSHDSSEPIGEDPLYAVPEQVKKRIRERESNTGGTQIQSLPESVTSQLTEARDLMAKAQSSRGSDDVVALMLLTQFKGILDKVLRDPAVISNAKLSQQIRAKREEGIKLYNEWKPQKEKSTKSTEVHAICARCGQLRYLDSSQMLCGPCVLRVKMSS